MKKRRIIILSSIFTVLLAVALWVIIGNKALKLNSYSISCDNLPNAFDGYKIAHISDLHNAEMGKNNKKLISKLEKANPDIIVITGDMIDSRNTNVELALDFAKQALEIAPCYYVLGNHEARIEEYDDLREGLLNLGVVVLEDDCVDIEISGERITLIGVNDPSFNYDYSMGDEKTVMENKLDEFVTNGDTYTVLLSHRPELFDTYVESGVNLVFSGHAHGGQFRLPFIGGLVAPNQGLFPEYDSGIYTKGDTNMVVSRGIGNSIIPLRFNNRPEVILIELYANEN